MWGRQCPKPVLSRKGLTPPWSAACAGRGCVCVWLLFIEGAPKYPLLGESGRTSGWVLEEGRIHVPGSVLGLRAMSPQPGPDLVGVVDEHLCRGW